MARKPTGSIRKDANGYEVRVTIEGNCRLPLRLGPRDEEGARQRGALVADYASKLRSAGLLEDPTALEILRSIALYGGQKQLTAAKDLLDRQELLDRICNASSDGDSRWMRDLNRATEDGDEYCGTDNMTQTEAGLFAMNATRLGWRVFAVRSSGGVRAKPAQRSNGTGTIEWRGKNVQHCWVKVSLPDGTRQRYRMCPEDCAGPVCVCRSWSEEKIHEVAAVVSDRERARVRCSAAGSDGLTVASGIAE